MTITNGYANLASFKTRFNMQGTDASRDSEVEAIIQAVSRLIDAHTHRVFFASASDEARYFTADDPTILFPDDIVSITSIKTDEDGDGVYETTWATSDFRTQPLNVVANVTPIMWIELRPNGTKTFPTQEGGVEITGKFGYCTLANAPDLAKEACYLQSFRIWERQSAPFGVVGSAEMGQLMAISKFDPDVEFMLAPLRKGVL